MYMLAEISFDWRQKITPEQAKAFANMAEVEYTDVVDSVEIDSNGKVELKSWQKFIVDVEDVKGILPDTDFKVGRVYKSKSTFADVIEKAEQLARKLEAMNFNQERDYNQKVEVHVPNLGLLMVNETTWLEDSCTEVLQDHLDKGWRILAICPQPDQRRPDYILGRTKRD